MVGRYPVVAICGNKKYTSDFKSAKSSLTALGQIVITIGPDDVEEKVTFKDLDAKKIDLADYLFIINHDTELDEGLIDCINYAKNLNKRVDYLYTLN